MSRNRLDAFENQTSQSSYQNKHTSNISRDVGRERNRQYKPSYIDQPHQPHQSYQATSHHNPRYQTRDRERERESHGVLSSTHHDQGYHTATSTHFSRHNSSTTPVAPPRPTQPLPRHPHSGAPVSSAAPNITTSAGLRSVHQQSHQLQGIPATPLSPHENPHMIYTSRQYRKLHVSGLPLLDGKLTGPLIKKFFEQYLKRLNFSTPDPVISVSLTLGDRPFCFIEFRSVLDTDAVVQLLERAEMGGVPLTIKRPRDFIGVPFDLKNFIVGYPAGSYLPPPEYTNELLLLGDGGVKNNETGIDGKGVESGTILPSMQPINLKKLTSSLPELPHNGELTIEEQYNYINLISKKSSNDIVSSLSSILTPAISLHSTLPTTQTYQSLESTSLQNDSINFTHFGPQSDIIQVFLSDSEKTLNDIDFLDFSDDFVTFINQQIYGILGEYGQIPYFSHIVVPRKNKPMDIIQDGEKINKMSPQGIEMSSNIDPNTYIYTAPGLLGLQKAVSDGADMKDVQGYKIVGVCGELAQKFIGTCFIICSNIDISSTLIEILNSTHYTKQLLYAQYGDAAVVKGLLQYLPAEEQIAQLQGSIQQSEKVNQHNTTKHDEGQLGMNNNDDNYLQEEEVMF